MIPLSPVATEAGIQAYTAFSPEHLMDLVNIVLLLAPVPAFYIAAALLMKKRTSGKSDTVFRFHITVVLFFLAFLLFANTGFGLARDWDLAAPLGILLTVPAMRLAGIGGKRSNTDRSIMPLAMLLSALPWLIVQLGDESSARRFERVVELDSDIMFADYALSGFEALRKHYVHSEEIDDEIRIEKRMVERLGYPEHYRLLLKSSLTLTPSQPERATEHLNWMLERLHKQISGLLDKRVDRDYAMSMEQADSISTAVAYQAYFFGLHPGLNGKFNELEKLGLKTPGIVIKGMDAFAAERYQDALNLTKSAFERGFMTGKLAALHANSLLMLGRTAEAEASFDVALNRFPADPELRYLAAYGYLVKGINTARARRLLEEAAGMDATDELRAEINSLLEKLRAAGFTSPP
jgi:tetratricopeptide (TPR) repeat protein